MEIQNAEIIHFTLRLRRNIFKVETERKAPQHKTTEGFPFPQRLWEVILDLTSREEKELITIRLYKHQAQILAWLALTSDRRKEHKPPIFKAFRLKGKTLATFEKRKNSLGETTAIRVKIRRVGMPHLSQTFPVANGTQTALKQAEKAAKSWVEEVTKGFGMQHGNIKSFKAQFNQLRMNQSPLDIQESHINTRLPFDRVITKDLGDHSILLADRPYSKMLTALLLDCGLGMEEIKRLRWQNVLFNQKMIEVYGISGMFQRQVPLTELTLEMLLAHSQRKYGLVFNDSASTQYSKLPIQLLSKFQQKNETDLALSLKREAAHRMADWGASESAICAYLGITNIQTLNNNMGLMPKMQPEMQ